MFHCLHVDKVFNVSGEVAVRINPVSSSLAADDLAAVLSARRLPNALVVPKVETPDDVHWVFDQVQQLLSKRPVRQQQGRGSTADGDRVQKSDRQEPMAFIPMCESAMALFNLRCVLVGQNTSQLHACFDVEPRRGVCVKSERVVRHSCSKLDRC